MRGMHSRTWVEDSAGRRVYPRPIVRPAPTAGDWETPMPASAPERGRRGPPRVEAALARAQMLVSRQSLVVAAVTMAGEDPAPHLARLTAMERHLADLEAWRDHLQAEPGEDQRPGLRDLPGFP